MWYQLDYALNCVKNRNKCRWNLMPLKCWHRAKNTSNPHWRRGTQAQCATIRTALGQLNHHSFVLSQKTMKTTPNTMATGAHFRIKAYRQNTKAGSEFWFTTYPSQKKITCLFLKHLHLPLNFIDNSLCNLITIILNWSQQLWHTSYKWPAKSSSCVCLLDK